MKKLNLAIIGQGRSGRDIHGKYYLSESNAYYTVRYVVELDAERRAEARKRYAGCEALACYQELLGKKDVDLVVNATYSDTHYSITKDLLQHGFNVLVEKPFARNQYECEDLIRTAKENNAVLAVFQQTFYAPYYIKAKEIIDSGILGDLVQVNVNFSGLSRRWDWQTLQKRLGGNAYNTGPHPIGIAYGLLDFDKGIKVVYSGLKHTEMYSGDAEDYVKLLIKTQNGPLVDVELSETDAFCDYNLKIQGSKGTYKSTVGKAEMVYIKDGENPPREIVFESMKNEKGEPMYCREELKTHTEEIVFNGTAFDKGTAGLYEDLYYKITEGRKMYIEPENIVMVVGAIEKLHADNPLPLQY